MKKELTESGKHIILYRNYSSFNTAFLIINGVIDIVILSFLRYRKAIREVLS